MSTKIKRETATVTPSEASAMLIDIFSVYSKYYTTDDRYRLAVAMACAALLKQEETNNND